jgi:hypothetical protein
MLYPEFPTKVAPADGIFFAVARDSKPFPRIVSVGESDDSAAVDCKIVGVTAITLDTVSYINPL